MTMLERVARAMDTVTTGPDAGDLVISEMFSAEIWRMMGGRLARAAIEAMREPTLEMVHFGERPISFGRENGGALYMARDAYRAMIDAALAGDG